MKKLGDFVCKHRKLIIIATILLLIPALIGYVKTKINYDILVYLPEDIETIQGEKVLTNDFNMGAYAVIVAENMKDKDIIKLEDRVREVEGVNKVVSINDITGTTIPLEFLPNEITSKVTNGNSRLILVTFNNSTSDDITLAAVEEIRTLVNKESKVGGMSAMVLDTKELFNSEMALYVAVAVLLCIVVLMISLDSYLVPILLILNIGVAILFNMGSNILLGNISYITKAISAVLQLGVTTDFSIFLYHKYEKAKKENKDDVNKAMSEAIHETLVSVLGSSLTTIAGFLALCTMNLTLGTDIGIVMAKGVIFGVLCVVTLFPALLLTFDKQIEKTKHKEILPKFNILKNFVMNHYKLILVVFIILLFPAYKAQQKTGVYYKLDESIPADYGYSKATKTLKDDYKIVSQEIILVSKDMKAAKVNQMVNEIENVEGINLVLSSSSLSSLGLDESMLNDEIRSSLENDKYKIVLVNSTYDIATEELNEQIEAVNNIVKSYDKNAIVAGEGPLMKDLVQTTDQDFKNVNVTSIAVIFVLMLLVLKSISLPVLLVTAIEFAIFINMGVPYFTGVEIPFIASVVIGTIQLGATIDYAILMTTKYLEERQNGKDKKQAVKGALDNSVSSIFVSGMCFFAATIGVSLVSKIDMIGSLCTLISRGAIISMIVVMTIVPSLLIVFDKLITKTTIGFKKKGKINMKNKTKKVIATSLCLLMTFHALPVSALTKDEVVYSKLNENGKSEYTIVTEHLINDEKLETIIDASDLNNIENTSGDEAFKLDGNKLTWTASKKDIYYKGTSTKKLPVEMNVSYKFNGKDSKVSDMLGKSGKVEITINYKNNEKHGDLYTPFVVATTTTIDATTTKNLKVTNGKVISNGINYVIAGVTAPGLYESLNLDELKGMDTVTISYDTTKFELGSIYSAITSKVLDEVDLDKLNKLDEIYSKIDTLQKSSEKLVDGTKSVNDGAKKIRNGVVGAITKLQSNNETIDEATINNIKSMAGESAKQKIESQKETIMKAAMQKVVETENATHQIKNASDAGVDANATLIDALKLEAHKQMQQDPNGAQAYGACNAGMTEYCAYVTAAENQAIASAKERMYQSALELAKQTAAKTAYETALQTAVETASATSEKIAVTVATQVKNTIINKVAVSLNELVGGLDQLVEGTENLANGMEQFNEQGINKISSVVNNNLKDTTNKVKELKKLASDYESFTKKADEITSETKFITVIESQKVKEEVKETKKETKEETFADRLMNLFK